MSRFVVYSHEISNPESELMYICECKSMDGAKYVVKALEYRDKGGNDNNMGLYEYYIREIDDRKS